MTPRPGLRARARRGRMNRVVVSAVLPSRSLLRRGKCPSAAECGAGCVNFRVWAPDHAAVDVVIGEASWPLDDEGNGYFSASVSSIGPGTLYRFRLDESPELFPDPASRFQPFGPHGPSEVICPDTYQWRNPRRGAQRRGQVIYEMHIGTLHAAGTSARRPASWNALGDLGVTVIEADAAQRISRTIRLGLRRRQPFAPCQVYGRPDDFREFADAAHENGLAVILDVVYNHLGPDGNYLGTFAANYFSRDHDDRMGRRHQLRWRGCRRSARVLHRKRRILDPMNSGSTGCGWTRRSQYLTIRRSIYWRRSTQAARAAAEEPLLIVAKTNRRMRAFCNRRRRAAPESARCGTTTFITRRGLR